MVIKRKHILIVVAISALIGVFILYQDEIIPDVKVPYEGEVAFLYSHGPPGAEEDPDTVNFSITRLCGDYIDVIYPLTRATTDEYIDTLSKPSVHYMYEFGHGGQNGFDIHDGTSNGATVTFPMIEEAMEDRQPIKIAFLNSCQCFIYTGEDGWYPNSVPAPEDDFYTAIDDLLRKGSLEGTAVFGFRDLPEWSGQSGMWNIVMSELEEAIFEDGMSTGEAFYYVSDLYYDFCHEQLRMSGDTNLKASDIVYV